MRLRWPFRVALAAIVVGTAALVLVPVARSAWASWRQRQQDHRDRLASARWLKHAQPAMRLLATLSTPSDLRSCVTHQQTLQTGVVCWRGSASPVTVTAAFVRELRTIGGRDVVAECVRNRVLGPMCRVSVSIAGSEFSALAGPQVSGVNGHYVNHGVDLHGDLFLGVPVLPQGQPIPIPA